MPTYDYKCLKCNKTFEVFQRITDEVLSTCLDCGGSLKRVIGSGSGLIFKGNGFYITDYKKNTHKEKDKDLNTPTKDSSKNNK